MQFAFSLVSRGLPNIEVLNIEGNKKYIFVNKEKNECVFLRRIEYFETSLVKYYKYKCTTSGTPFTKVKTQKLIS